MEYVENTFTCRTRIGYSDLDDKTTLRPSSLVSILQNSAISHSNAAGYDLGWFSDNEYGWVLLHWHIRIERLPEEGEEMYVSTWAMPHKRTQASRDFLMKNERGEEVCYASSRWVLLNSRTRKPIRFDKEFVERYRCAAPHNFREETFRIGIPEEGDSPLFCREFVTTRRDTDFNGHINNVAYVDWALDDIPEEIYRNCQISDIRVEYKKECPPGSSIKSTCYLRKLSHDQEEILSVFTNAADPKTTHSIVATVWRHP